MKKTRIRHLLALLLATGLLLLTSTLPVGAITPSYQVSSAYRKSTYYQNLLQLPLTGDGAFDTLSAALSQYGYHEGSSSADYGGTNTASTGNYTEYNYALGRIGGSFSYAWCAAFVSWCLVQAGEQDSAGGLFASCTLWVEALQGLGQYHKRGTYTPQMGDLIFFRSAGVARASDHVGLVRFVKNGRVYTVEGNSSGQVALRDYALGDSYIVGYGSPRYENKGMKIDRAKKEDTVAGYYIVTYDFLNVRAARSASSAKKGQLKKGELFLVTEVKNGWGRVSYNGSVAYVSLEYADFVAPSVHKISYVSEGKTLLSRELFSTEEASVSALIPEKKGYEFLGWADANGTLYEGGARLPSQDLVLTARWREIPPPPVIEETEDAPQEEDTTENGAQNGTADETLREEENVPQEDASPPLTVLSPDVQSRDFTLASRVASAVCALLGGACIGGWYLLYKKRE